MHQITSHRQTGEKRGERREQNNRCRFQIAQPLDELSPIKTMFFFGLLIVQILLLSGTSSSSPLSFLLEQLRDDRRIEIEEKASSKADEVVRRGSSIELVCSFSTNFDDFDLFWLHNGTLVHSFLSQVNHRLSSPSIVQSNFDVAETPRRPSVLSPNAISLDVPSGRHQ